MGSPTDAIRKGVEEQLGVRSAIVSRFANKSNSPDFWTDWFTNMRAQGTLGLFAWDPTMGIADDPSSSLRSVLAGEHDDYIRHWARQMAEYRHPVLIRLWAEMNGNWQPYSPRINGNTIEEFAPAWRHVVDIVRAAGATNVLWIWNPIKPYRIATPLAPLWPGDAYVNWVGLDTYNWGGEANGPWREFGDVMGPAVRAVRQIAPRKPLMIPEIGTNETSHGDKGGWLTRMFTSLPSYGVQALIYFDQAMQGADWRLTSSPGSLAAAAAALHRAPMVTAGRLPVASMENYLVRGAWYTTRPTADFTGEGHADLGVFRPSTGAWHVREADAAVQWGQRGDVPVTENYTGDARAEIAVWRPSNGSWHIRGRAGPALPWGQRGDVPVAADFTGDGRAEIAVWRPSNGTWYIRGRSVTAYGQPGDVPVAADFTGDGRAEIAVWRPSIGAWYIRGRSVTGYGQPGDVPVVGDYNGDGRADLAVFRPTTGAWHIRGVDAIPFGVSGDIPVPGDYYGDGTMIAVFRPSTGVWYLRPWYRGGIGAFQFGGAGDVPLL